MQVEAEARNRIVMERLLSDFTTQLNGAIDFWTVVCLGSVPVNPREFLWAKAERLNSVLSVLAGVASSSFPQQKLQPELKNMEDNCQRLCDAFLVLERFRTIDHNQLRAATETIAETYHSLRAGVRWIVAILGIDSPEALALNPERQAYYARILSELFDLACKQRGSANSAVATPA